MGVYQVTMLKKSPAEAIKPIEHEVFVDFRDAMKGPCSYSCTVLDFFTICIDTALSSSPRVGDEIKLVRPF